MHGGLFIGDTANQVHAGAGLFFGNELGWEMTQRSSFCGPKPFRHMLSCRVLWARVLCAICLLSMLLLGACASVCPDKAERAARHARHDSPDRAAARMSAATSGTSETPADSAAMPGPATRDVFHRPSSNTTVLLLDRHPAPGEWTGPLTMGAAIRVGLLHSNTLAACLAELGVNAEQGRNLPESQGRGEVAEAFFESPLGYAQLAPGWPRALAEEHVRTVLQAAGIRTAEDARLKRLELTAVAAALDVILDVREHWYMLVGASQSHIATTDELLAAEAAWQMADSSGSAAPVSPVSPGATVPPAGSPRAEARARLEAAQRESLKTDLALREARRRMQQSMGIPGNDEAWNVPPLLPGKPLREFALDDRSLEEAQWRSVNASIDLALARLDVSVEPLANDIAWRAEEYRTVRPQMSAGEAGKEQLRPSRLETAPAGAPGSAGSAGGAGVGGSAWANWAFPAPFFSPSFVSRSATQPARERDWRRYQAMAAVVRSATRSAGEELLAARKALEHLEELHPSRRTSHLALAGVDDFKNGATLLTSGEQDALLRRRAHISAQLDYWIARSRLEHLLAGRLAVGQSPATFRQVSIMQPVAE